MTWVNVNDKLVPRLPCWGVRQEAVILHGMSCIRPISDELWNLSIFVSNGFKTNKDYCFLLDGDFELFRRIHCFVSSKGTVVKFTNPSHGQYYTLQDLCCQRVGTCGPMDKVKVGRRLLFGEIYFLNYLHKWIKRFESTKGWTKHLFSCKTELFIIRSDINYWKIPKLFPPQ